MGIGVARLDATVVGELSLIIAGIRTAGSFVLAVGVRIKLRAIAGVVYDLLGHCGARQRGGDNRYSAKNLESRHWSLRCLGQRPTASALRTFRNLRSRCQTEVRFRIRLRELQTDVKFQHLQVRKAG